MIVLTTTVANFIADRGWEDLPPEYWQSTYRIVDMFGLSATLIAFFFSALGWFFGRLAVAMAPIVLLYVAVPYSLDASENAVLWWAGAIAAVLWWLIQARFSLQQIHAVHTLASVSDTGATVELGPVAGKTLRRIKRRSLCWATGLSSIAILGWLAAITALPAAVGRTYQELDDLALSDYLGTPAATMSVLALAQWHRCGWTFLACRCVGTLVWHVPVVGGPVQGLWSSLSEDAGTVPLGQANSLPSCTCIEEYLRADPDEEDLYGDIGVLASAYCPVHGIDQINSLTAEQFRSLATTSWLWDEDSLVPVSTQADADRTLLIGYAGNAFTGLPARFINGMAEIHVGSDHLAEERELQTNESQWERPLPPLGGVLDRIDLRPAGLGGRAIRYQHGRAWFEAAGDASRCPSSVEE
ncbi:hypothetical protein ACSYDW_13815 [Paeniglutamicibacter sp. R2-26]|uniref:hypothetical protein n=1 Tax=Paeniglutamicibacter sp. R2-26 TaxID=3144417 RepID=UPI003EE74875